MLYKTVISMKDPLEKCGALHTVMADICMAGLVNMALAS